MKPFHGWHTADRPGRKFLNPLPSPKRLDELHTLKENKANRLKKPIEDPIFTPKQDNLRTPYFCEVAVTPGAGAGAGSAGVELTGAGWPTRR